MDLPARATVPTHMRELPHAPGFTLTADAFMEPGQLVGFSIAHHHVTCLQPLPRLLRAGARSCGGPASIRPPQVADRVGRGCVVFVVPGVSHGWELCEDLVVYNCFVRARRRDSTSHGPSETRVWDRLFAPAGDFPGLPIEVTLDEDRIRANATRTSRRSANEPPATGARPSTSATCSSPLDVLARELEHERPDTRAPGPLPRRSSSRRCGLLERDLRRHWTLEALASELCVGVFYLVRLFKRWVGMPPIAYANQRRAERAAVLLSGTRRLVRRRSVPRSGGRTPPTSRVASAMSTAWARGPTGPAAASTEAWSPPHRDRPGTPRPIIRTPRWIGDTVVGGRSACDR